MKPIVLTITDLNIANKVFDLENTISLVTKSEIITPEESEALLSDLYDAENSHSFFSSLVFYLVTGVKH
jgi:hypothetical protein